MYKWNNFMRYVKLSAIKNVIAFLKRSGLSEKFLTALKQSNETRWNCTFITLTSFDESYQQIQDFLQKHNQEDRLSNIDSSVLKCLN